jgi:hypothetical protein
MIDWETIAAFAGLLALQTAWITRSLRSIEARLGRVEDRVSAIEVALARLDQRMTAIEH